MGPRRPRRRCVLLLRLTGWRRTRRWSEVTAASRYSWRRPRRRGIVLLHSMGGRRTGRRSEVACVGLDSWRRTRWWCVVLSLGVVAGLTIVIDRRQLNRTRGRSAQLLGIFAAETHVEVKDGRVCGFGCLWQKQNRTEGQQDKCWRPKGK